MTRIHKILLVTALTVVGVWGCAKAPPAAVSTDKAKQLEARVSKLEAELKDAVTGRDAFRVRLADAEAKLAAAETRVTQLTTRAVGAERERDDLRGRLQAKATERDQLQAQFDAFRKNIKDLLGRAEATAVTPAAGGQSPVVAGLKAGGF